MFAPVPIFVVSPRAVRALAVFALLLAAPAAFATNLVVNPGFDGGAAGWKLWSQAGKLTSEWRPEDATSDPGSGSFRLTHLGDRALGYAGATQCVPVAGGATHAVAGRLRIPAGQAATGRAVIELDWYSGPGCSSDLLNAEFAVQRETTPGGWSLEGALVGAPGGAHSVFLQLGVFINAPGAPLVADFDDIRLDDGAADDPPPPYGSWISSSGLPGFVAQVRITAGAPPLQGSKEGDCIAETICASGALPGRPEVFVKVIGPRPNGFYWVQLIRFTPSQVEVWLRQQSSQQVNYYVLGPTTGSVLRGLEDREAFLP